MSQVVTIELDLPDEFAQFRLPPAVNARLRQLLDRQERGVPLKEVERREAEGLVELAELLTLLRLRAEGAALRPSRLDGRELDLGRIATTCRFRAADRCEYCGLAQEGQEATFHIDHIVPRAAMGATTASNLALACVSCSLRKQSRRSGRDPRTGRTIPLFNPRRQLWANHFGWEAFTVVGLTPTGANDSGHSQVESPFDSGHPRQEAVRGRHPLCR